jgi:hypothetical protein
MFLTGSLCFFFLTVVALVKGLYLCCAGQLHYLEYATVQQVALGGYDHDNPELIGSHPQENNN